MFIVYIVITKYRLKEYFIQEMKTQILHLSGCGTFYFESTPENLHHLYYPALNEVCYLSELTSSLYVPSELYIGAVGSSANKTPKGELVPNPCAWSF